MRFEVTVQPNNDNSPTFITSDDNGYEMSVSITAAEGDRIAKVIMKHQDRLVVI